VKIAKKIFSMLFEDFHWKLLALAAAGVIWFVGMHMSNPPQNRIVPVRLQIDNLEIMAREGIVILNEDELREINVSVHVRGLRSDMSNLNSAMADPERLAEFITVSADFRAISTEAVTNADGVSVQTLRISPNLQAGFEHISINPTYIEVRLDTSHRKHAGVQVIQHGDVPPGFELQYIRLGNENVTIRGPRSEIRTVSLVQANVDISGVHEDTEITVPFKVIDINGSEMTDRVQLNVTETMAHVRVLRVQPVNIAVYDTGSPAAGFAFAGISGGLDAVSVVGSAEALEQLDYIRVEINLANASNNTRRMINIADWLPEGVSLRQGETEQMEIVARIEPIEERIFNIPRENVRSRGVVGLYQLVSGNANVRVVISGPRSIIQGLDAQDIVPEFDLRGLAIGVHTVPLSFELPRGLAVVGTNPTLMVQIHEPAIANNENPSIPEPPEPPDEIEEIEEENEEEPEENEEEEYDED
jgi:YbbR domain-containing protein